MIKLYIFKKKMIKISKEIDDCISLHKKQVFNSVKFSKFISMITRIRSLVKSQNNILAYWEYEKDLINISLLLWHSYVVNTFNEKWSNQSSWFLIGHCFGYFFCFLAYYLIKKTIFRGYSRKESKNFSEHYPIFLYNVYLKWSICYDTIYFTIF